MLVVFIEVMFDGYDIAPEAAAVLRKRHAAVRDCMNLLAQIGVAAAVFPHAYFHKDGMIYPGDAPGLGVDLDEELAKKHPYQRAYLPVNRKLDGTLADW